jgi:hypothetical protein
MTGRPTPSSEPKAEPPTPKSSPIPASSHLTEATPEQYGDQFVIGAQNGPAKPTV